MRRVLTAATLATAGVLVAGGAYVAARIRADALRVRPAGSPTHPMTIRAMSATEVRIDPGGAAVSPALVSLGLRWPGGAAELGPVVAAAPRHGVTRRILRVDGPPPPPGTPARISATPWGEDPSSALGHRFEDISYPGPAGLLRAWWVPGPGETCAVVVHGRGADREEGLRLLGPLGEAGLPALLIRYRNDPGCAGDGIARFGQTEWRDLAAAVDAAAARGARRILLVGLSMGGAIAMAYLERREHRLPVVGAILDSPVLSLGATVDAKAGRAVGGLAGLGPVPLGRRISSWRDGIDWRAIDYLSRAAELRVPVLLIHDRDDALIPIATSDALAARRPDLVHYRVTRGAGHTLSWNADPVGYAAAVREFAGGLAGGSAGAPGGS